MLFILPFRKQNSENRMVQFRNYMNLFVHHRNKLGLWQLIAEIPSFNFRKGMRRSKTVFDPTHNTFEFVLN